MNLPLLLMVTAAKDKIRALSDVEFKEVAQEFDDFINEEIKRRSNNG